MPLELAVWRVDQGVEPVEFSSLELESRLEDILEKDISIASPHWMVIGRQVPTSFGKFVDLLAIDQDGRLIILELKRDKTSRDIVAQTLDYGSWVKSLRADAIAEIFKSYQGKYRLDRPPVYIGDAFCERFKVAEMPEELNESHEMVIVASTLDLGTERIVKYLAEEYDVRINAVFFRVFRDAGHEYLCRAWLNDPLQVDISPEGAADIAKNWNGEFYVSFGADSNRDWEEARKYGFISGGGGPWYSRTLNLLEPGARIWVNVPSRGYVGVGEVTEAEVWLDEFMVTDAQGKRVALTSLPVKAANLIKASDNEERAEHFVKIKWIKTVPLSEAVKEKGFFGNQNTVAQPKTPKWQHTIERLKKRWGIA